MKSKVSRISTKKRSSINGLVSHPLSRFAVVVSQRLDAALEEKNLEEKNLDELLAQYHDEVLQHV
jgi:hypothetical protein